MFGSHMSPVRDIPVEEEPIEHSHLLMWVIGPHSWLAKSVSLTCQPVRITASSAPNSVLYPLPLVMRHPFPLETYGASI
jgi:hypothetical protein